LQLISNVIPASPGKALTMGWGRRLRGSGALACYFIPMTPNHHKLIEAAEAYFLHLARLRACGGSTEERSSYAPLANLLNTVGALVKPKVFCISELADQGAGHPDFGLYGAKQVERGRPRHGQLPECGVVEVKGAKEDIQQTAHGAQVNRYWNRYRLVLVTNTREFLLVGSNGSGQPAPLPPFRLGEDLKDFEHRLQQPRALAQELGVGLGEYLIRAFRHRAVLAEPQDLAWLLASYARDGLARVEAAGNVPALMVVRSALEEALGVRFKKDQGQRFFRSTLVQTLFYGIFSAWVLWAQEEPPPSGGFNWRTAVWHLRVPVLQALFSQLTQPDRLHSLGLVPLLDWTAEALERVDHRAFFSRFNGGEAVPYFYEPFLEAFDPDLRKQLGVWYTPPGVVRYMVARVDRALKEDLAIAQGLAAENVYVLDPCCGTGAYLAEVLQRMATNLESQGLGALAGARVKQAAMERVFGFEIMPAPFVVAHLQVGLTMQGLDAALDHGGKERAGVFLTNALTGWEPRINKPLPLPELAEERDQAEQVKQGRPILVILGNPPYNGFAGMAVEEERELSHAYRTTKRVPPPKGQGLNDPYVRFFSMAERRIAEKTGQGVICFISNYSWLDGLSFTGMRERYLEVFDAVRIDCLNGDTRKGNKAPDGSPDGSIFTTESTVGIKVGTAITTLVRKENHQPADTVNFRHLWGRGQDKGAELLQTAEEAADVLYERIKPVPALGLPFMSTVVSSQWFHWPALPELFSVSFPGVKTSRDSFLVDIDLDQLKARIGDYFDAALSHGDIARRYPSVMKSTARFDAHGVREALLKRGGPNQDGFVPFAYRPFDHRWLYWEADTKLLDEKRSNYRPHVFEGNLWFSFNKKPQKGGAEPRACPIQHIGCHDLIGNATCFFPLWLQNEEFSSHACSNLSLAAQHYLNNLGASASNLFHHVLATLHNPAYRTANVGGLGLGWPRIPLPGWPDGKAQGAQAVLMASAARGRKLAALLNPDRPVPGVTEGQLTPESAAIAVPATVNGRNMQGSDFAVSVGWGRYGAGNAVMPGPGQAMERAYQSEERAALREVLPILGETTFDLHLNGNAYWRNVPSAIWHYKLGGYQVLKKWLSYREQKVLKRPLRHQEVHYFSATARRIGAILVTTASSGCQALG